MKLIKDLTKAGISQEYINLILNEVLKEKSDLKLRIISKFDVKSDDNFNKDYILKTIKSVEL